MRYWLPEKLIFSPANTARAISTVSRIRASGWANGTPCRPSITWGPETPSPSRNLPPDRWASVIAVCAIVTGERVPTWITPEPSSIVWVCAARYPSRDGASVPQASATQQTSRPSFSASRTNSVISAQFPPEPSMVVAVRIRRCLGQFLDGGQVAVKPDSNSRSRTKTIFCSFSGIASMARFRPERAGPICAHCSSTVPVPSGRRVNRQVDQGWPGSPTAHANRGGLSHSMIVLTVSQLPRAGWRCGRRKRWPTAGPLTPSSHSTSCSSVLSPAIR